MQEVNKDSIKIIQAIIAGYKDFCEEKTTNEPFPIDTSIIEIVKSKDNEVEVKIGDENHLFVFMRSGNCRMFLMRREYPFTIGNLKGNICIFLKESYKNYLIQNEITEELARKQIHMSLNFIQTHKDGTLGNVINAMCEKMVYLKKRNEITEDRYGIYFRIRSTIDNEPAFIPARNACLNFYWKDRDFSLNSTDDEDTFSGDYENLTTMPKKYIEKFGSSEITPENLKYYSYTIYPVPKY